MKRAIVIVSIYDDTAKLDYRLGIGSTGLFAGRHAPNVSWNDTTQYIMSTSTWYMATLVYDGTSIYLYVNGILHNSKAVSSSGSGTATTSTKIGRGASPTANIYYYDGIIDDVAILDRALNADEISALYNGNGSDIRFTTDSAGVTEVPFEIVGLDTNEETAEIWVKVPTVDYNDDTIFYMWYGNSDAVPYAANATYGSENVWDSAYKAVYHNNNDNDSTANSNDLTKVNTPVHATGKIGDGLDLESGSSQRSIKSDTASLSITGDMTLSALVKFESHTGGEMSIMGKYDSGHPNYLLMWNDTGDNLQLYINGTNKNYNWVAPALATWFFVTAAYDASAGQVKFYIDGQLVGTQTGLPTSITDGTANFALGAYFTAGTAAGFFDGMIDEARVQNRINSDDWVETEYNNQNSPGTFLTIADPSDIKKVSGILRANIKKISGIAIANVDKISGLA